MSTTNETKGFYKLSWLQRIGFGAGDLAQNLIYQTICMYLLFFYTDVYVLGGDAAKSAGLAGTMFLVVRLVDVLWDPLVGTFVDKHNPSLGKYRSYLVTGGIPLTILAILCFWDGFAPSIIYAYLTYVGMSMLYTLINVPYGALNSSLTRDTDEITVLTSVRMFMANVGGLAVSAGVPILVAIFASSETLPIEMALFMGLGSLPSFIFMPLVPAIKKKVGKKNMFYIFLSVAIIGMGMLYVISKMGTVKENITLVYIAQFIKSLVCRIHHRSSYRRYRERPDRYLLQGRYGSGWCRSGARAGYDQLRSRRRGYHSAEELWCMVHHNAHLLSRWSRPTSLLLLTDKGACGNG